MWTLCHHSCPCCSVGRCVISAITNVRLYHFDVVQTFVCIILALYKRSFVSSWRCTNVRLYHLGVVIV